MSPDLEKELISAAETAESLCALIEKWADAEQEEAFEIMDDIVAMAQGEKQPTRALEMAKQEKAGEYPHKRFSAPYWQTRHALAHRKLLGAERSFRRIVDCLAGEKSVKAEMIRSTAKAEIENCQKGRPE